MDYKKLEYWITKKGEKLYVDEMSNKHVRNTLKYLLRKINYLKLKEKTIRKSNKAFEVHGDIAQEYDDAYSIYKATGIDILSDDLL